MDVTGVCVRTQCACQPACRGAGVCAVGVEGVGTCHAAGMWWRMKVHVCVCLCQCVCVSVCECVCACLHECSAAGGWRWGGQGRWPSCACQQLLIVRSVQRGRWWRLGGWVRVPCACRPAACKGAGVVAADVQVVGTCHAASVWWRMKVQGCVRVSVCVCECVCVCVCMLT